MKDSAPAFLRTVATSAILGVFVSLTVGCTSGQSALSPETDTLNMAMSIIEPGTLTYYPPGEYLRDGYPATPAQMTIRFDQKLFISTRQVSQAEYSVCVRERGCQPLDRQHANSTNSELPVVGISWRDATDYAKWLSGKTGKNYRLPTYEEWVYAAGSSYTEDLLLEEFDNSDPAQRWLAQYALETKRKTSIDSALQPFGSFGVNDDGVMDMAGNVWDWTDTCHTRQYSDSEGVPLAAGSENCGVRVVAGEHRSYIPDFIRDAKSGACSVGVPPSNLGFRLVLSTQTSTQSNSPSMRDMLGLT